MADDRMKNDEFQKNMGTKGTEGQNYGQQTPGRTGQGHEGGGQQAGRQQGQQGGQQSGGQFGNQRDSRNMEDDDLGAGGAGQTGGQGRGGQNR